MEQSPEQYSNEKEKKLNKLRGELERTIDGLGAKIDSGIFDTIIYLNALNIETRQSCEGHIDRGLPYSWVDIIVPAKSSDMYNQYKKECRNFDNTSDFEDHKKYIAFYEIQSQKYKDILDKVKFEEVEIRKKIENILVEFQKKNPDVLKYRLDEGFRLLPLDVPKLHINKWIEGLSLSEKKEFLTRSQESMKKFTEYLKESYLNQD